MSDLEPHIVFFLEREKQIEEWMKLRKEVTKSANNFFRSLADGFSRLSETLDGSPELLHSLEEGTPKLFFYRSAWSRPEHQYPRVAIGLEWNRSSATFTSSYAGIWVNRKGEEAADLDGFGSTLKMLIEEERQAGDFSSTSWWPLWRYERPLESEYWNNLEAFRQEIFKDVKDLWQTLYPKVDQALDLAG